MNVRRHNKVVHIVHIVSYVKTGIDSNDKYTTLACGRHAKLSNYSRNTLTDDPPTCVLCLIGDAFGKDFVPRAS